MRKKKSTIKYEIIQPADIKTGMEIRVHHKIKDIIIPEKEKMKKTQAKVIIKERIQYFEGLVIKKHGAKEIGSTFTVRKISNGVGVEKVFPLHSPLITKVELVKSYKTRRKNLTYIRTQHRKLKEIKNLPAKKTAKVAK